MQIHQALYRYELKPNNKQRINILLEGISPEEFNKHYPKFSGKLRLWGSSKTEPELSSDEAGSLKQEASTSLTAG